MTEKESVLLTFFPVMSSIYVITPTFEFTTVLGFFFFHFISMQWVLIWG